MCSEASKHAHICWILARCLNYTQKTDHYSALRLHSKCVVYNLAAVAKNDNFLTIHTLSLIRVLYWLCQIKPVIKMKVCEDDNTIASLLKLWYS